jgi:hypothetical protein
MYVEALVPCQSVKQQATQDNRHVAHFAMNAHTVACFCRDHATLGRNDEDFILHISSRNPEAVWTDAAYRNVLESDLSPDESVISRYRDLRWVGNR